MSKCKCQDRDNEGLCKYKFVGGDMIYCMDKSRGLFCMEEKEQTQIMRKRWKRIQKAR